MTQFRTRGILAGACAAALVVAASLLPEPAEASRRAERVRAEPPFCVLITGPRGIPLPQICRFYDYDDCLEAAAHLRGNCVINIEYRGPITTDPRTLPPRRARPHREW